MTKEKDLHNIAVEAVDNTIIADTKCATAAQRLLKRLAIVQWVNGHLLLKSMQQTLFVVQRQLLESLPIDKLAIEQTVLHST